MESFPKSSEKKRGERLVAFLRRRHPVKTADSVASDTGIPAANVAKWLAGASLPSFSASIALMLAYDIDFWAAVLPNPPACIVAELTDRRIAALTADIDARQREIERLAR